MRRDIGNEVIAAIAVVSVLAFALIFGIVLSLTGAPQDGVETTEPVNMEGAETVVTDDAPTETRTLIVILPSPTPSATATVTDTPAPTRDFESEINAISTQVAAALTATVDEDPTNNSEPTATETATIPQRTRAATQILTSAPQAADTEVRITDVASATNTVFVTATPTNTNTVTTPALTEIARATHSQAARAVPAATSTAVMPAMLIGGATATLIPVTPMGSACSAPRGWITFAVPQNITLYTIARTVGSNVGELRLINCLGDFDNITPASLIYVPVRPVGMATGIPVQPTALTIDESACAVDSVTITEPVAYSEITGVFIVRGMATLGDFRSYRIEVRPAFSERYDFYLQRNEPGIVEGGELGIVNSDLYEDGLHYLRLVVRTGSRHQSCEIPVIFR